MDKKNKIHFVFCNACMSKPSKTQILLSRDHKHHWHNRNVEGFRSWVEVFIVTNSILLVSHLVEKHTLLWTSEIKHILHPFSSNSTTIAFNGWPTFLTIRIQTFSHSYAMFTGTIRKTLQMGLFDIGSIIRCRLMETHYMELLKVCEFAYVQATHRYQQINQRDVYL